MVMTVPPGGPTCRQVCAGAAIAAVSATATAPSHLPFIGMPFSQSAEALTSCECREIPVISRLFHRTDFGPCFPGRSYYHHRHAGEKRPAGGEETPIVTPMGVDSGCGPAARPRIE